MDKPFVVTTSCSLCGNYKPTIAITPLYHICEGCCSTLFSTYLPKGLDAIEEVFIAENLI